MINSDRARELARRSIFNNIDEQLRYLFEDIEETASMGRYTFKIDSYMTKGVYDHNLWIEGVRNNTNDWKKIKGIIEDKGFSIKYYYIRQNEDYIIISWE